MSIPRKIINSGILLIIATILSRSLGFIREIVNAYCFGISRMMDAYNVADTFPHLINIILVEGIISTVYIPVFTYVLKKKGKAEFWKLFSNLFFISLILSSFISAILIIFGAPIAHTLFSGMFVGKVHIAMILWKILNVLIIFRVLMCLFMGALNSLEHFFIPAIAPVILNIVIILFLIFGPKNSIYSLAYGIVVGTLFQFFLYLPVLYKLGAKLTFYINFKDRMIKRIYLMFFPVIICLLIGNINFLVIVKSFASSISGAVSAFSYAFKFIQLPVSVFAIALSIVSFPYINYVKDKKKEFSEIFIFFSESIGIIIFPIITVLIILSYPIVKIVFFRGMFDLKAIEMTSYIVRVFALNIIPLSFLPFIIKIYYAKNKMNIPILTSSLCVILNISLYFLKPNIKFFKWIAIGYVISLFVNLIILIYNLKFMNIFVSKILFLFSKISFVCIILGILLRQGYLRMLTFNIEPYIAISSSSAIFFSLYIIIGYLLNFPVFNKLFNNSRI